MPAGPMTDLEASREDGLGRKGTIRKGGPAVKRIPPSKKIKLK